MGARDESNWIAGRRCPSETGARYEGPAEDDGPAPRWPRSDAADLERALHAADAVALLWWERPAHRRRAALVGVVERLAADVETPERLAAALGLEPDELFPADLAALPERLAPALDPWGDGLHDEDGPGTTMVVADWREGLAALALRVLGELRSGRAVVLVPDRCLPRAGEAIAAALATSDLPPGAFGLLHDDGASLLRAARLRAPGPLWSVTEDSDRAAAALAGAGDAPAVRVAPLSRQTAVVRRSEDPGRAAQRIVRRAFGRSSTLSGQLPVQVGRVLCHELGLSAFTAALLEELTRRLAARPPVVLVEPAVERHVRAAVSLGLDEGACLIHGGDRWRPPDSPSGSSERRDGTGRSRLRPAVFTNVDPSLRFLRLRRPGPLLALVRVSSDREALELERELEEEKPRAPHGAVRAQPEPWSPVR